MTDAREPRKDIGGFWLSPQQMMERRERSELPGDGIIGVGLPVRVRRAQGPSRIETMRNVLIVLEEITQTIANTARVARLPRNREEQLEDLVQPIRKEMERLMQKLHRSGEASGSRPGGET